MAPSKRPQNNKDDDDLNVRRVSRRLQQQVIPRRPRRFVRIATCTGDRRTANASIFLHSEAIQARALIKMGEDITPTPATLTLFTMYGNEGFAVLDGRRSDPLKHSWRKNNYTQFFL